MEPAIMDAHNGTYSTTPTGMVRFEDLLTALHLRLMRPRRFEIIFDDLTKSLADETTSNTEGRANSPTKGS